jgi:chemotaxis protein CheD
LKHIVGVADMMVSGRSDDELVTHALGSCLGIVIYDPVARVGGLLHVMLPQSSIDEKKAADNPFMFVDTGVPLLFKETYRLGAEKARLIVKVAGGASLHSRDSDDHFNIGKRNFIALRKLLWKNGVLLRSYDVGGNHSRTMSLAIGSGDVEIRVNGVGKPL